MGRLVRPWRAAATALMLGLCGCQAWHDREAASKDPARDAQVQQVSRQAQDAIDRGDPATALALLQQMVALAPRSAEAHHRIGRVLQEQGRLAEARASQARALEIDDEYVNALIAMGEVELAMGRPDEALVRLDAAIEINPAPSEAHLARGRALQALGRPDDALAAYFRALNGDPNLTAAMLQVAAIQLARKQPEQALARLTHALDLTPDDPEALHGRGMALLMLDRPALAAADLRKAADRLPDRPEVFYHLALALEANHQAPADALKAAEHALSLAPGYSDAKALSERLRR
ncbi:tetratricopeptide repeat protein [Isosphaeraceae bacterium EP7]